MSHKNINRTAFLILLLLGVQSGAVTSKFGMVSALRNFNNSIYAGNGNGILFISHDNGKTWASIITPMYNDSLLPYKRFIWDITVEKNIIYLASSVGVYKADVSSFNWVPINNGLPDSSVTSLCLFKGKLFTVARSFSNPFSNLYLFDDTGQKWNKVLSIGSQFVTSPFTSHDSTLYCAAESKIYSTIDSGKTWKETPFKELFPDDKYISIEFIAFDNDIVIGCSTDGYIMRSSDFCKSWTVIEKGIPWASMPIIYSLFYTYGIALVGYNGGGLSVDTTIKISLNNGITWKKANFELNSGVNCFAMRDNRIYAGTDDGLIYSDDSLQTWHFVDDPTSVNSPDKKITKSTLFCLTGVTEINLYNLQGKLLATLKIDRSRIMDIQRYLQRNSTANEILIVSVKYADTIRNFKFVNTVK